MLDLVVVGAGIAGLIAGNRAAELGCRVTVLEAGTDRYLCNSRIATGSLNFAHSNPELPPAQLIDAINADTEGHADPALAAAIAAVAGRGLRWLKDNGAQFVRQEMQGKMSWMLAPPRSLVPGLDWRGRGADVLLDVLAERLKARGGELMTGTSAQSLLVKEGHVCGVSAQTSGKTVSIDARNVVLADGGFQGNAKMVGRYICARPEKLVQRSAGTGLGDGIRMASEIGARLVDMNRFYGHLLSRAAFQNASLWPYPTLDSMTNGSILVGSDGNRLFDEGLGGITLSNLIAEMDDPTSTWIIFDEEIWTTTGYDEVVPANPHLIEAGGTVISAKTIEELAAKAGLPAGPLASTVAAYNNAVESGRGDQLVPPRSLGRRFGVIRNATERVPVRPVRRAPFYAAPLAVGITCTMGGLAIDVNARVIREDGKPIPGLYAAGQTSAGLEGGPIAGYIGGLAKSYCTALLAAEAIAAGQDGRLS
ncbi:FAD-binding protein [Roseiarcaceae bacterium H3SJ34-1]|uniref:FAD-dependent oxidoreductase n=1 Tax=Terripilifer ovatus TaxID=3032367 RepID=UPI003AB965BC|nr:FAD-binding protein [Roseiarcaceae bacterium H3SJ34-1]